MEVISRAYPARIEAALALRAAASGHPDPERLRLAASELEGVSSLYGRAAVARAYCAYADLVRICSQLCHWRSAVLGAELEADRHVRAAKAKVRLWMDEYKALPETGSMVVVARSISATESTEQALEVCDSLAKVPLPVGINAGPPQHMLRAKSDRGAPPPPELQVAFLRFGVDGFPAAETHFLTPAVVHDLDVEVRLSRWPDRATKLVLWPVTVEPASCYEMPSFEFLRPTGDPPFVLRAAGRAILKFPQSLGARPYEFRYTASFRPESSEQPVAVVGQRTLRLEGVDLARSPITGYPGIDAKLVSIRDRLRAHVRTVPTDIENALTVVSTLGAFAGRVVQDSLLDEVSGEKAFQREIRAELRRNPAIGPDLEEHPEVAGGITDLSFRGIRIELKYETTGPVSIDDCARYLGQTQSYVVGSAKSIGVLCVLDHSAKKGAPFPVEDGIEIIEITPVKSTLYVIVVLLQGRLARPSALSR